MIVYVRQRPNPVIRAGAALNARRQLYMDEFHVLTKLDPCVYCGGPSETREHILPRSLGGDSSWENIAQACKRCNNERDNFPLLWFLVNRGSDSLAKKFHVFERVEGL